MRDGAGGYGQRESHVACRPLEPPSPNGLSRSCMEWSRLTSGTKLGGRPLYTKTPELRDRLGSLFDRMLVDSDRSRPGQR